MIQNTKHTKCCKKRQKNVQHRNSYRHIASAFKCGLIMFKQATYG